MYASDTHAVSCSSTTQTTQSQLHQATESSRPVHKEHTTTQCKCVSTATQARTLNADWTPHDHSMACLTTTPLTATKLKRNSQLRTYAHRPHLRTAATHYEANSNGVFAVPSRTPSRGLCAHHKVSALKTGTAECSNGMPYEELDPAQSIWDGAIIQACIFDKDTTYSIFSIY